MTWGIKFGQTEGPHDKREARIFIAVVLAIVLMGVAYGALKGDRSARLEARIEKLERAAK